MPYDGGGKSQTQRGDLFFPLNMREKRTSDSRLPLIAMSLR